MRAVICDGCKNFLSEKAVEFVSTKYKRVELCQACRWKLIELNKWEEEQDSKLQEEYKKLQEEYKRKLEAIGIEF